MRTARMLRVFTYVVVLLVGILTGIGIKHYHDIPLSTEFNLIDIVTLLVTIFLAVYIPEVIDHKMQNTRDKKALLENRISEFLSILKDVNSSVQDDATLDEREFLLLQNSLDISKNKLETIVSLLGYANLDTSFESDIATLRELTDKHSKLLKVTKTSSGGVVYPKGIKDKEETLYNEIDKASSLLIFKISDS